MSDDNEYSASSIISTCFSVIVVCVVMGFWGFVMYEVGSWGFDRFWNSGTDKTERWISMDKQLGYYTKGLDGKWVSFTNGWLTVKGKMRKSLYPNDTRYDLVCKVNAKLTPPKLKTDSVNEIVESYEFYLKFNLIDEDGFIIHTLQSQTGYFTIEHEKNEGYIVWTKEKYPYKEIEVTSEALYQSVIPEGIAQRVNKITYVPTIKAKIEDKDKDPNILEKKLTEIIEKQKKLKNGTGTIVDLVQDE
jgi:hypothetical protein